MSTTNPSRYVFPETIKTDIQLQYFSVQSLRNINTDTLHNYRSPWTEAAIFKQLEIILQLFNLITKTKQPLRPNITFEYFTSRE